MIGRASGFGSAMVSAKDSTSVRSVFSSGSRSTNCWVGTASMDGGDMVG